jgi:uncharacterized protein (DUF1778 family)
VSRAALLQIRLSDEQKAEIQRRAEERGQTMTDYVLACALGESTELDARYALAERVLTTIVGDRADHLRAVARLRAYAEAGGIDLRDVADGDGDIYGQAAVIALLPS